MCMVRSPQAISGVAGLALGNAPYGDSDRTASTDRDRNPASKAERVDGSISTRKMRRIMAGWRTPMLTEPPPTRLPFRNGPSGASVQHFVIRITVQAGGLIAIHDISRLIHCESLRRDKSSHRLHRMDDTPIDRLLQQRRLHEQYHQLPA